MSAHRTMESYTAGRAPQLARRTETVRLEADGTPRPVIVLSVLLAIAALAIVLGSVAPSHAVQLESADREVSTVRVTYVEPVGARKLYVELNNGATYRLNPCRSEDGRGCYWDANGMGNGVGRSFVVVSGRVIYSRMVGDAR